MTEALLLTGGASRRMGADKSAIQVEGEPLAARIARLLQESGTPVTVAGGSPLPGHAFLPDRERFAGPLAAIAGFSPRHPFVLVVSCDLPGFDCKVVGALLDRIGEDDACVPRIGGREQPLCALYRESTFEIARHVADAGCRRVLDWLARLTVRYVDELPHRWVTGVNTSQELEAFGRLPKEPPL